MPMVKDRTFLIGCVALLVGIMGLTWATGFAAVAQGVPDQLVFQSMLGPILGVVLLLAAFVVVRKA